MLEFGRTLSLLFFSLRQKTHQNLISHKNSQKIYTWNFVKFTRHQLTQCMNKGGPIFTGKQHLEFGSIIVRIIYEM